MKYRSITLNGNKGVPYALVKYTKEYKRYLEKLRELNPELADSVEQGPKIYSEQSEHQSYMIFSGRRDCVGAIYIGTSTDEKNLEIKLHFKEKYFKTNYDIVAVIEQLVDSLGLYFYDKENIEIELCNDIDLSQFNKYRFKKKVYDAKLTTYTCSNRNHIIIPAILNEMEQTEKNLLEWNQAWMQKYNLCSFMDYDYEFDLPLLEAYEKGTVPESEMFYKAESIYWPGITSTNSTRNIDFNRNGKIHFDKSSKSLNGINYEFDYYVLSDGFNFKTHGFFNKKYLEIEDNSYYTKMKQNGLTILKDKETNRKRIEYRTPIINNSSIQIELWEDAENSIERCYIDFRTHKGNGKVNGLYALRIIPKYNVCTLNFISRDGFRYGDFSKQLVENSEELYSSIFEGNLTYELIDELIRKVIPIINHRAINTSRKTIAQENNTAICNVLEIENEAINFIKQIKGEIPLPHLHSNVENFVENNKSKTDSVKKLLKK